ncbi:MAG: ABC transporter permease, partial [SAR324 cluster bacterium]|nr:ABC transporter permease [SAR324 cluster bacterium]
MKAAFSLFRYQLRYWRRHRLQALLSLTGIVLGVAVFSAIRMANEGALAAFSEGVEAFAGRATHRVFSPAGAQVPDEVFGRLVALPGVVAATPYLEDSLRVEETPAGGSFAVTVLGIDPLSGEPFYTFRFSGAGGAENPSGGAPGLIEEFLSEPGAVILSAPLARRLGLSPGATLRSRILGQSRMLRVVGVFRPAPGSGEAFAGVALADVSTHQELFGKLGGVDAITLILREGGEAPVSAALPEGLALERIGKRSERIAVMAEAFQLNLEAMGLFALLVAAFLVFNAATFSVVQRRREIAIVRCIGAPAGAVLGALLLEALVLGVVAGILGVALGRMLAGIMLSQTQATLFEVILLTKAEFIVSLGGWKIWVIGILLGVITSLLGAWWPAREAKGVSPVFALSAARGAPARGQGWRPAAAGGMLLLLL